MNLPIFVLKSYCLYLRHGAPYGLRLSGCRRWIAELTERDRMQRAVKALTKPS